MVFGVSILSLLSFTIIFVLSVEKNLIHASSAVNVTNAIYVWTVMIGSRFKKITTNKWLFFIVYYMIGFYSSLCFLRFLSCFMIWVIIVVLSNRCQSPNASKAISAVLLFVVSFRLFKTIRFCLFRSFSVCFLAASLVPSYSVQKCQPPTCLQGKQCTLEDMSFFGYGKYLQISTARHVCLRLVASALYGDLQYCRTFTTIVLCGGQLQKILQQ